MDKLLTEEIRSEVRFWEAIVCAAIITECTLGRMAFKEIVAWSKDPNKLGVDQQQRLIGSIHSLLIHSALLSKLLKAEHTKQKGTIAKVLDVGGKLTLHDQNFRHYLEHYDEKIEGWTSKVKKGMTAATQMAFKSTEIKDLKKEGVVLIKVYEYDTWIFQTVDDKRINLRKLDKELEDILISAQAEIVKIDSAR